MLTQLSIRDFAIIDELDLNLAGGMSVLTGETGAGKSILLDALSLVLGDRAESGVVRHGAARADITAVFDVQAVAGASQWLLEHDLDSGEDCVLRRVIGADGRSKSYINGRPAPLASLRELGESLVDIHGQHEHQSLLKDAVQRELLDEFGELQEQVEHTAVAFRAWRASADELEALRLAADHRDERLDLLRYQVAELEALAPRDDELDALEQEQRRLSSAHEISSLLERISVELYERDDSLHDRLARLADRTGELMQADPPLQSLQGLLESARINVGEAVAEARDRAGRSDADPQRLEEIDARLGALHELARKHRVEPAQLAAETLRLRDELDQLEHAGSRLEQSTADTQRLLDEYCASAGALRKKRVKAAAKLGKSVTRQMQSLGMEGGRFEAKVVSDPQAAPTRHGADSISFMVSANPGQPLQPLRKVASGGELSRISLAIQLIASGVSHIPTLIFDEVDAGIGGATADMVGQKLATLGEHFQTLCVTHLAQVAARASQHLQVSKISGPNATRTRVRMLSDSERIDEIARMLGGVEITPQSLAHAESLVRSKAG